MKKKYSFAPLIISICTFIFCFYVSYYLLIITTFIDHNRSFYFIMFLIYIIGTILSLIGGIISKFHNSGLIILLISALLISSCCFVYRTLFLLIPGVLNALGALLGYVFYKEYNKDSSC